MKIKLLKSLKLLFLLVFSTNLFSQIDLGNVREGETVEYCLQHKKFQELKQNPDFLNQYIIDQESLKQTEEFLANQTDPQRVVYKIPIVFHVLHNGGVENITNEQIIDALNIMNRDFRLLNSDANNVHDDFKATNPLATCTPSDIEVEFVLATKAPNGVCFSGITRTQSAQSYSGNGGAQVDAIVSGNDVYNGEWPGNRYLNIFICGDIGGAAGYTYKPSGWIGTGMDNGIWVLSEYVGSIGTGTIGRSRTLTHEAGHWLNLDHTWGPNNNPGNATSCSDDDAVTDTPNTIGVTFCNLNENTCGPRANVENYMDYSYCSKMFSNGQKNRMRAALNNSTGGRNNLWTSTNLVATGADGDTYLCAANFYSNMTKICPGEQIQFFDNSYNNVTGWTWTFEGATQTSSIERNPVITYNTPGVYPVTLTATDGSVSLTKTVLDYVTVLAPGEELPILDGFENYTSIATSGSWEIYNPQNNAKFEITSSSGHLSSKSVKLANYGQSGSNIDELISNSVDLSEITSSANVTLSFRYSYRKRSETNTEKLFVLLTGNCGETWEIRKTLQGNQFSSLVSTSAWTPTLEEDWTTVHLTNIISQYWNENFRYKFRFEGQGGNNLYLDNINIYPSAPSEELVGGETSSLVEIGLDKYISIYPNPAENEVTIEYKTDSPNLTSIQILDVLGKVHSRELINSQAGNNMVVLSTNNLSSGVYLVKIYLNGKEIIKQITIN
jgi:PKD repeat protein